MFAKYLENVRTKAPLIHNITNYVTVNDCANILLACGGAPIMADNYDEVEEITSICAGLNINIGTFNKDTVSAMFLAGKKSNAVGHPVLLDPVGAGASTLRTQTSFKMLNEISLSVIRGNVSEIKTLALGTGTTRGVDADIADLITEKNIEDSIHFAKMFAKKTDTIVAITGEIDIVADSRSAYVIRNGHPMMGKITGTGCMLSALITAYIAANPANSTAAVAAAVCAMGLCGELAHARLGPKEGNATYRTYIIDEVYHLDGTTLESGAKYEVR